MRTSNPVQAQENDSEKCGQLLIPSGQSTFSTEHLGTGTGSGPHVPTPPYATTLSPSTPYNQPFNARVPSIPTL